MVTFYLRSVVIYDHPGKCDDLAIAVYAGGLSIEHHVHPFWCYRVHLGRVGSSKVLQVTVPPCRTLLGPVNHPNLPAGVVEAECCRWKGLRTVQTPLLDVVQHCGGNTLGVSAFCEAVPNLGRRDGCGVVHFQQVAFIRQRQLQHNTFSRYNQHTTNFKDIFQFRSPLAVTQILESVCAHDPVQNPIRVFGFGKHQEVVGPNREFPRVNASLLSLLDRIHLHRAL